MIKKAVKLYQWRQMGQSDTWHGSKDHNKLATEPQWKSRSTIQKEAVLTHSSQALNQWQAQPAAFLFHCLAPFQNTSASIHTNLSDLKPFFFSWVDSISHANLRELFWKIGKEDP